MEKVPYAIWKATRDSFGYMEKTFNHNLNRIKIYEKAGFDEETLERTKKSLLESYTKAKDCLEAYDFSQGNFIVKGQLKSCQQKLGKMRMELVKRGWLTT